jgi:phospholipid/cholesterol/gamma-HCH transport system substrate-binding protein
MTGSRRLMAIAIALMLIAGSIALALKPSQQSRTIQVTGLFTKTIGLFPSSRVMVLGVAVGRVVSVTPAGNDVKVVMRIDRSRKIPADARATIVPISLISDRYVQLFPPYSSGATLQDDAVIGTDRTFVPAELDELLAQLKKLLDALQQGTDQGSTALGTLVSNLANALRGVGGDLSATLAGGGKVSATILTRSADLDGVIVHLSSLISALAQRRTDLVDLNTHLAEALGAIADERGSLGGALSNIALLTDQLSSLVHDHKAALETDLQTLAKTTQAVIRHQDSLIRTLQWVPVLDDGVEGHHNGGAVHFGGPGPVHIDVRDAHLTTCPPAVPVALCVLLGLEGIPISASSPAGTPRAPAAPSVVPKVSPAIPGTSTAPDLLDLLHKLPLLGPSASSNAAPTPSSTPGGMLGGLLDRVGGALDHALRWLW